MEKNVEIKRRKLIKKRRNKRSKRKREERLESVFASIQITNSKKKKE